MREWKRFVRWAVSFVLLPVVAAPGRAQTSAAWNVDANGTFGTGANWTGGTPPGAGGTATFGYLANLSLTGARTVTVDTTPTLAQIDFDSAMAYTLAAGGGSLNLPAAGGTANVLNSQRNTLFNLTLGHTISAPITGGSAAAGLTVNGPGKLNLSGPNSYQGGTAVNGATLYANADAALGAAAPANALTLSGGGQFSNVAAFASARNVVVGPGGGVFTTLAGLTLSGQVTGSDTLVKRNGGSTLTLQGDSPGFTGTVRVEGGTLALSSPGGSSAGSLAAVPSFDVAGTLALDNAGGNNANRLGAAAGVVSRGGTLTLTGNAGAATNQSFASLTLDSGTTLVTVTPNAAQAAGFAASGVTRNNRSTLFVRGTNLGGPPGPNTANFTLVTPPGPLVGGGGAAGTPDVSVVPYIVGSPSATGTQAGTGLVTYDAATLRLRPLAPATEYAAGFGGAATNNVRLTATAAVPAGGTTVNALVLDGAAPVEVTGAAGDVLAVTSGAVVSAAGSNTAAVNTVSAPLNFGAAEGVVHARISTTLTGVISGSNGLTVAGTGAEFVALNVANTYTGPTTLLGGITLVGADVPSSATTPGPLGRSTTPVVLSPGSSAARLWADGVNVTIDRGITVTGGGAAFAAVGNNAGTEQVVVNGPVQLNGTNRLGSQFLRVETTGGLASALVLNGPVSGPGGITDSTAFGPDIPPFVILNGNNTYSGGTNVRYGTYVAGSDTAFGTGPIFLNSTNFVGPTAVDRAGTVQAGGTGVRTVPNNVVNLPGPAFPTFGGSQEMVFTGNVFLGAVGSFTFTSTATTTFAGVVSDGQLQKFGPGTLALTNAANAYTGRTFVVNGTLLVGNNAGAASGALGTNANAANAVVLTAGPTQPTDTVSLLVGGPFTVGKGIVYNGLNTAGVTRLGGTNTAGTATFTGPVALARSVELTAAAGGTVNFGGAIAETAAAGLTKVGGGTVTLSNAGGSTVTGPVAVNAGTLRAENMSGSATGSGAVTVAAGATLAGTGRVAPTGGSGVAVGGRVQPGPAVGANRRVEAGGAVSFASASVVALRIAAAGPSAGANTGGSTQGAVPNPTNTTFLTLNGAGGINFDPGVVFEVEAAGVTFEPNQPYSYRVGQFTGLGTPLNVTNAANFVAVGFAASGFSLTSNGAGAVFLNFTPVPEPAGLLALCAVAGVVRRRAGRGPCPRR